MGKPSRYRECLVCKASFKVRNHKKICSIQCRNIYTSFGQKEFEAQIQKGDEPDACWLWIGNKGSHGYGEFTHILTHRYSYELYVGPIPSGKVILHSCDIKLCVNPRHLSVGTQADNMRDAVEKGRVARGERMGSAKLKTEDVLIIRKMVKEGQHSYITISKNYGVCWETIRKIALRQTWTHLSDDL